MEKNKKGQTARQKDNQEAVTSVKPKKQEFEVSFNLQECPTMKMFVGFGYQEVIRDPCQSSVSVWVRPEAELQRLGSESMLAGGCEEPEPMSLCFCSFFQREFSDKGDELQL